MADRREGSKPPGALECLNHECHTMSATMSADRITTLNVAFDDYPQTRALKRGEVKSDRVALNFSDIKPANRFFKPMVRELKFDISEMAIATYLQAKAYGKPLTLLPATIMPRFQHNTVVYSAARGTLTPADLPGKRVGVRSYSQRSEEHTSELQSL